MTLRNEPRSLLDRAILLRAARESVLKLDPRRMARNPVMFVVEIGSVSSPVLAIADPSVFAWLVAAWLWFTVLFANFAEAVAEGRGKAQADELRKTRAETIAHRRRNGTLEDVPSSALRVGDEVVVTAGEVIPADGDGDRGDRERRRVGDHRRVGAGDPRVRRRPLGRDRRHARALGRDRRAASPPRRARASSTG